MDSIDRKILKALQQRADITNAELGEIVSASAASVWRRVKALEVEGILGPTVRLVDRKAVGQPLDVLCQVRMRSHDLAARAEFERFVADRAEVMECYSMSGEWDYLLRVVMASVADYDRFLMRELLAQPAVASSASHFALQCVKYSTALPV